MEAQYYREMLDNCEELIRIGVLPYKKIFLFGHCNATEELADLLEKKGYTVTAILDNNPMKHGKRYREIPIIPPNSVLAEKADEVIVCIVTRFYEAMCAQLRELGFSGEVRKLVDYNTYAEYSLSDETIERKRMRVEYGRSVIEELQKRHPAHFRIFCPFPALGDMCFCMSYLPEFLKLRGREKYVVCVVGNACAKVVRLFDDCPVEVMQQRELDAAIQAELYLQDEDSFIAHQDRPYVVKLHKALYHKRITLEEMYCCGVFGLSRETKPTAPKWWKQYGDLHTIPKNQAVVLSPYAKSVTALSTEVWKEIIAFYRRQGYQLFTNVVGTEKPLEGTLPISPEISEMKSVVERAGIFIGIRSGLCDVIRTADCRKIALYPDYNYSDTQWKSIDIYAIDTFENMVVKDGDKWEKK